MTSAFHVYFGPDAVAATPRVRRMRLGDCFSALSEGFDDFLSTRTYPVFVGLFYAVAGIALFAMASFEHALQLAFPLAAGFALIGPFVAIGLYEMSRRRERGLHRQRARRVHGPALAVASLDPGVWPSAARDLRRLVVRGRARYCAGSMTRSACRGDTLSSGCRDDRARLDLDDRWRARRLLLRSALRLRLALSHSP